MGGAPAKRWRRKLYAAAVSAALWAVAAGSPAQTATATTWAARDVEDAAGQPLREQLFDAEDGQLDLSSFLAHRHGFLPVPIIITEPAVGYGGGVALLFLRQQRGAGEEGLLRPDISAVGGMATDNGTWAGFLGDSSHWFSGRLRTLVGGGTGRVNLDFYGLGDGAFRDVGVGYTLKFSGGIAQADWRVQPDAPWWLGQRFAYAHIEPQLRDAALFPGLIDRLRTTVAAPTLLLTYDSRDRTLTPTRGVFAETSWMTSRDALGASVEFSRFGQIVMGWLPLRQDVTLALRADWQSASGGTPFYLQPYVDMRGVAAMRYAGDRVVTGQAEARWQFHGRWSAVVFGGIGDTRSERGPLTPTQDVSAGGAGFRYEIARRFGLHVGIDVARSAGTTAFYIIIGNAWLRP